jgi:cell division protein FtsB
MAAAWGIPPTATLWHDRAITNEQQPMSQRLSISAIIFFALMTLLGVYFAYAAVQGPSGILRRVQLQAETKALVQQRDSLQAEVDEMRNLTHRLSDEYLDIDLLDERARDVLGLVRADEIIIR